MLFASVITIAIVRNKDILFKNKLKLTEILIFLSVLLVTLLNFAIRLINNEDLSTIAGNVSIWIVLLLAFMAGVAFIFHGAKENRLFFTNIGFLTDGALAYYLIITRDAGLLANGLALLTLGGILLGINLFISKRKKVAELK